MPLYSCQRQWNHQYHRTGNKAETREMSSYPRATHFTGCDIISAFKGK